jgi:hypothetical protein
MPSPYNKENTVKIPSFNKKVHHLKTIHVWSVFISSSGYQWRKRRRNNIYFPKNALFLSYDVIQDSVTPTQAL